MSPGALAFLPVAVPLAAAALVAGLAGLLPRRAADGAALAAAGAAGAASWRLMTLSSKGLVVAWLGGWLPKAGTAAGIGLAIDPFGAGLALLACVLTLAALIFSLRYFDGVGGLFHALLLCFLAGMCGFCLTGDLFNLFVFFELMSAAAYSLCGYKIEAPEAMRGAFNFAVMNTMGAFLVLTGIALVYGRTGALNLAQIGRALSAAGPDPLPAAAFAFIACGLFVKAAVVPFHFWLDDAHAVAPTPVCVLFSGVMVELALYGVARVYWGGFQGAFAGREALLRQALVGAGTATAVLGALMCFTQRNIKRLLAYSTISHVGVLVCALGLLSAPALAGAALYVAGHGLVKGALFLGAGALLHAHGTVDELELHGRGVRATPTEAVFLAGGLLLAGLPPCSLARGHAMIAHAAQTGGAGWLRAVLAFSSLVTGGAVLRVWAGVFRGLGARGAGYQPGGRRIAEARETRRGRRMPWEMAGTAGALLALSVILGLWTPAADGCRAAAARFTDGPAYRARVLYGAEPPPAAPSPEPGSRGADAAHAAALALGAAALGLAARSRLWPTQGALARAGQRLMAPLHAVHSGRVGDYAAFFALGAAGFAWALVAAAAR